MRSTLSPLFEDHRQMHDGLHGLFHILAADLIPIERRTAIAMPPNRLMTQRRLHGAASDAHGCAAMMRLSKPYLTPARTGLIMVLVLVLGAIIVRVITGSERSDVRTPATPETGGRVAPDAGVVGLRGSLP